MSQAHVAYRWKTSDLDRLPDEPLLRYEIIDGALIVSRRPHLEHSEIIMTLGSFIRPVVRPLAILSPALPERNPENTPGASSRPSPAAAARSEAWHGNARSGQVTQDSVRLRL